MAHVDIRRILSLDGGGMKGLFSAHFMRQFCVDAGIAIRDHDGTLNANGNYSDLNQYFDFISGTSIGGISALAYAAGYSPNYVINFLSTYGPQIFTSFFGTPMPTWQKMNCFINATALGGVDFYTGGSLYGAGSQGDKPNAVMLAQLINAFGESYKMGQLPTNVLIPSVEVRPRVDASPIYRPLLFSNLLLPGVEGQRYKVYEVALATGAAPIYLPPARPADAPSQYYYIDGGLYQNNPAPLTYALNQILNQGINTPVSVLSVGCGLGTVGFFDPTEPPPNGPNAATNLQDNFNYLNDIIGIGTGGPQEANDRQLQWLSKAIRNFYYFRFNTVFDPSVNTELDNSSVDFQNYMRIMSENQYDLDKQKIIAFIQNSGF